MIARNELHRYILIGGSVYLFELLVIYVMQKIGYNSIISIGVSFWVGLLLSFMLQKLVTFNDKRIHRKVLLTQTLAFLVLVIFNFGFTILLAKLFAHILPAVLIRTVAIAITTIWNFYLYRTHIFANANTNEIIY